jgi:Delta7-sterol 5-desaturase
VIVCVCVLTLAPRVRRYFHTNFGQNLRLWDWLFGTERVADREYGEDVFGGQGRAKTA